MSNILKMDRINELEVESIVNYFICIPKIKN